MTLNLFQKRVRRTRLRVRKAQRLRLSVFRSGRHMYAQIIDDARSVTLAAASTKDRELKLPKGSTMEAAAQVGKLLGSRAKAAGITTVVFDRGGYRYHGRVKALAESARQAGLEF